MRYDKNKMSIKGLVGQHSAVVCSSLAEGVSITIVLAIKRETNQVAAHFVILLSLVCSSVSQCTKILHDLSFQFSLFRPSKLTFHPSNETKTLLCFARHYMKWDVWGDFPPLCVCVCAAGKSLPSKAIAAFKSDIIRCDGSFWGTGPPPPGVHRQWGHVFCLIRLG